MIFKQVEPSKSVCFLFFPCQLFPFAKRLALECLSVPHHSISWWTDVAARWSRLVRTRFRRLVISIFWNTLMAIFKGLEPQNYTFGGNLWNSINSKFRWSISIVQTATKNLQKSLKISTQFICHESGMSPSNSQKSHLDVQSLYTFISRILEF